MKYVVAAAPGKLILFGEHAVVYGYPCLVSALDQRIQVRVSFLKKDDLVIAAPQLGIKKFKIKINAFGNKSIPKELSFLVAGVKRFYQKYHLQKGLSIATQCQFSFKFGFGSSSAVMIALLLALAKLYQIKLTKKQVFKLAYKAVLEVQKVGSGFDLAAALWGGTLLYQKPAKLVKPIKIKNLPLLVCYSGIKADTPTLIRQVLELKRKKPQKIKAIFKKIRQIVFQAKTYLEKEKWPELGKLMNENQKLLQKLNVSTPLLNKLLNTALKAGAWGAKISGAGGGDNIIILAPQAKRKAVAEALKKAGGKIIKVKLNSQGASCESHF